MTDEYQLFDFSNWYIKLYRYSLTCLGLFVGQIVSVTVILDFTKSSLHNLDFLPIILLTSVLLSGVLLWKEKVK